MSDTRAFLLAHAVAYPALTLTDLFKALYQSAFGCEHLVADSSAAEAYIAAEAEGARPCGRKSVEPLDGPYVRVHLDMLKKGLSARTLARLFALSAEHRDGAQAEFEKKLAVLTEMIRRGELPFDADEAERAISAWRAAGFPPCHHSEAFRQAYAPAYRLVKAAYAPLLPLLLEVDARLAQGRRTVLAIDGPCGSGKTTLAALLARLYDCPVFHADDFFLRPEQRTPARFAEPGGNLDRERLLEEVLTPLRQGQPVSFRRFDCHSLTLLPPVAVAPSSLAVVEGSYSLHPELAPMYDVSVCLTLSPELQRRRILARNGEAMAQRFFERWIPNTVPTTDYILEPSPESLQALLFPKLLNLTIYTTLLDTTTSEHAARMMAMQTANDNANDLIQELTLQYNKTRQQAITNELLDIMGGQ